MDDLVGFDAEGALLPLHRLAAVEAEGERDAQFRRRVGERGVEHLAVDDRDVAGVADERQGAGELLASSVALHPRLDVDLPELVRSRHDPETARRRRGIELHLEVEAVDAFVPVRRTPVGDAVLVPRHRTAETGLLDEDRVGEGHEVVAVDRRGDLEEERVAVEPQSGGHRLAHGVHEEDDVRRRVPVGQGLRHLRRVTAAQKPGAAPGVRQRLGEEVRRAGVVEPQGWPSLRVHFRVRTDRRALQHLVGVAAQFGHLVAVDESLEDVEAVLPVGRQDVRMELAAVGQANRSPVADLGGDAQPFFLVGRHAGGVLRPGGRRYYVVYALRVVHGGGGDSTVALGRGAYNSDLLIWASFIRCRWSPRFSVPR